MMKFLAGNGFSISHLVGASDVLFGGCCELSGAISPNTGLPLTQFARLTLDRGRFWIPAWTLPEIHFLYSWKCKIHEGDFSYRYVNGTIEVVEFCEGFENYEGFPYEDYPLFFEETYCELNAIDDEDHAIIVELNNPDGDPDFKYGNDRAWQLSVPRHQFGGVPYLLDSDNPEKYCPICNDEMTVVATIGNDSFSKNDGFFGNDFVQVVCWACGPCQVVSARNYCD